MLKKLTAVAIMLVSRGAIAQAAPDFDNPAVNLREEIEAVVVPPVPVPAAADAQIVPAKEWTIIVYLNGKNNLEYSGLKDVNEMEMVGSSDKVNVVVELGRSEGLTSADGDWKGVRRYLIQKDTDTKTIGSPVVEELGSADMGDYRNLIAFGNWAKTNYPAKRYMLIVWNHGSGWTDTKSVKRKGISYDYETKNHFTTPQLAQALKGLGGVDIYASDACLMQMAEVAVEIKDYAAYIAGSEESMPMDGYTYNKLLEPLVNNPSMTAEELGLLTVNSASDHYASIALGSTESLIRSTALPGFMSAVDEFAGAMMAADEKELVRKARDVTQKFRDQNNRDLYHFIRQVLSETSNAAVKEKGAALADYIKNTLVVRNRTVDEVIGWKVIRYDKAYGLAVALPLTSVLSPGYLELAWSRQGLWDDFLVWLPQP